MFNDWTLDAANSDIASLREKKGQTVYAVGCIYYEGLDHRFYYTDICTGWDADDGSFPFCADINRNFVR